MAPGAAPGNVGRDRSPVVMTAQARGVRVGSLQAMSGFFGMVEGEVLPQGAPIPPRMAEVASAGKCPVRRDGPPLLIPAGLPGVQAATKNGYQTRNDEPGCGRQSLFANAPHGSPGITQAQFQ